MDKFKDIYHAFAKLPKLDPFLYAHILNESNWNIFIYIYMIMIINFSDKRWDLFVRGHIENSFRY